jgi:hypothetical protein
VATPAEVDRVLRGLIRRFDEAEPSSKASLPSGRAIVCAITDLNIVYRGDYTGGRINGFARAKKDDVRGDIRIEMRSDDLIALAEGRLSLARALFTGRISVDAGARDLLLLRQLL